MMNNIKRIKSKTIQKLLQNRHARVYEKTKRLMMLAVKIQDGMKNKGFNKKQLAEKLGKHNSVLSKWLSGTHNFTADTLMDIENILNINLLALEDQRPQIVEKTYVALISTQNNLKREIRKQNNLDVYDSIQTITAKPLSENAFLSLPIYNVSYEC